MLPRCAFVGPGVVTVQYAFCCIIFIFFFILCQSTLRVLQVHTRVACCTCRNNAVGLTPELMCRTYHVHTIPSLARRPTSVDASRIPDPHAPLVTLRRTLTNVSSSASRLGHLGSGQRQSTELPVVARVDVDVGTD